MWDCWNSNSISNTQIQRKEARVCLECWQISWYSFVSASELSIFNILVPTPTIIWIWKIACRETELFQKLDFQKTHFAETILRPNRSRSRIWSKSCSSLELGYNQSKTASIRVYILSAGCFDTARTHYFGQEVLFSFVM